MDDPKYVMTSAGNISAHTNFLLNLN